MRFFLIAAIACLLAGCQHKRESCVEWEKLDYLCRDEQGRSKEHSSEVHESDKFGSCASEDLINRTCN